ncbi:MAG: hypothetical protein RJA87_2399 [Pseudomonadota bacterium]|jgi:tetratricopeptide (TPR) repeat protein
MPKSLLDRAHRALADQNPAQAERIARQATERFPKSSAAWRTLGLILQEAGRTLEAFEAYERALGLNPNDVDIALALSHAASRLGMKDEALALASYFVQTRPGDFAGISAQCTALLSLGRIQEAHDLAVQALGAAPQEAERWQLAGKTARASGGLEQAAQALQEALRLTPHDPRIQYDLAWTLADMGDLDPALNGVEQALAQPLDAETRATADFLRATILLAKGDLKAGWSAYQVRHDLALPSAAVFDLELPRWDGQSELEGHALVVMAEQGLGDEIAFMGMVPDLLDRLGPTGRMTLCADERLKGLIERSWPTVRAVGHQTQAQLARRHRSPSAPVEGDLWLPLGDLLPLLRSSLADFDQPAGFLKPDPVQVAHWKAWLKTLPDGTKTGMAWRSHKMGDERGRNFAPLSAWGPIFSKSGLTFVNLQYGDTTDECAQIAAQFGVTVHQAPELDLFNDLEGLAALSAALDIGIGFSNASTNLLGSVGTPLHLLTPPASWPTLGQSRYPWYPGTLVHEADTYGDWDGLMTKAASALSRSNIR